MQNIGKTRKVSTKYQGRIGAPPPPSEEAKASAARYQGSAKQRRDLAIAKSRAGERSRKMGETKRATFNPPVPSPGGGGGGAPAVAEEQDWWMNPWVWAVALGVLLVANQRLKK